MTYELITCFISYLTTTCKIDTVNSIKTTAKHLPISAGMKMADVIHLNYLLIPIIGRFGIDFGFGNKTVAEICSEKSIELSFFLEILNSYHNKNYFAEDQFEGYSLSLILTYLKNTHNYYLTIKIPELEDMVKRFIESSSDQNKANNTLIANFFESYRKELVKHLNQEESHLFPYTKELERAIESSVVSKDLMKKIKSNYSDHNDEDHNNLEEKLDDLKNLIIKFLPPVKRKDILEKLLIELFRLESDLNDHSRIEDKVLLPRIIQLEQKILELSE